MRSFFVKLLSSSVPQTFPNNTATAFDTKCDLVRRLDGDWSVALVAMTHPAQTPNMVHGCYYLISFALNTSPYWKRWR